MNYNEICDKVIETAKKAGEYIRNELLKVSKEEVESKSLNSFVTYVDKTAEKIIVDDLKQIIPKAGYIVEEDTETKKGDEYNWIVDPLDGTTNFIHKIKPFAVSIALSYQGEIVVGVVYEIGYDECFYAYKGSPAYLNGKEIRVNKTTKLKDSLISTGFPYQEYSKLPSFFKTLEYFLKNTRGVRRFGSAATDLVYVACGRFDAYFEYGLNPWDVAAGALIVQQAGGKVSDYSKGNNYIFGAEIAAACEGVFDEFIDVIKGDFKGWSL